LRVLSCQQVITKIEFKKTRKSPSSYFLLIFSQIFTLLFMSKTTTKNCIFASGWFCSTYRDIHKLKKKNICLITFHHFWFSKSDLKLNLRSILNDGIVSENTLWHLLYTPKVRLNTTWVQFHQHSTSRFFGAQIPKAQKRLTTWLSFLRFWDLRVQKLLVERWWNWPLMCTVIKSSMNVWRHLRMTPRWN